MTNNFLCIPNECTRIKYQPYEKQGGVRYRYPGQDWKLVDGDDFEIEDNRLGQCEETYYMIEYHYNSQSQITLSSSPPIPSKPLVLRKPVGKAIVVNPMAELKFEPRAGEVVTFSHGLYTATFNETVTNVRYEIRHSNGATYSAWIGLRAVPGSIKPKIIRLDGKPDDCGNCTLKIFKDGKIVYERTADDCPEAEILNPEQDGIDCKLADQVQTITIDKLPYLQRVEIRNQSIYPAYIFGQPVPLLDIKPLPDECLNIYKTYVLAAPILSNFIPLPGLIDPYQFVAQICSAPGCPPPKYEVVCNCGEFCPDETCAVSCQDVVCCYNPDTGIAVDEIPIEDYAGDLS